MIVISWTELLGRGVGDGGADSSRSPLPRSASHGSKPNDVHTKPHVLYRL